MCPNAGVSQIECYDGSACWCSFDLLVAKTVTMQDLTNQRLVSHFHPAEFGITAVDLLDTADEGEGPS